MKDMIISIHGLYDVYTFIEKAQLVCGDVNVKRGVYCVDGKSALGVLSIDMSQDVTVTYPASAKKFEEFIKQFEANK